MPLVKSELPTSCNLKMEKCVLFAGCRVPLSSLLITEANNNNQFLEEGALQELLGETELVIDTRAAELHSSKLGLNCYTERTLGRTVEILQHAPTVMSNSSFCFSVEVNKQVELQQKQPAYLASTMGKEDQAMGMNKHYIWKKSHGGFSELRSFISHCSAHEKTEWIKEIVRDKDILKSGNHKFFIIVGPEGTGKSTLLTHLTDLILQTYQTSDAANSLKWPVRVNLKEHSAFLNEKSKVFTDFESAFKLLVDLIRWPRQQANNLAKSLLRHRLLSEGGGVILMFDGLDEAGVKAQNTVINLMDTLSGLNGVERILVTGRSRAEGQPCARLEDRVNTLSYQMLDLDRNDKLQYLMKHWKFYSAKELESYPANEVERAMAEYANQVIAIKSAETGEETFGNWPFQCKMLAEIFHKDLLIALRCRNTKLANPLTNQTLSYLDFYRLFWAAMCDAFHSRIVTIVPLDVRSREDAVNILTRYLLRIAIKFCFSPADAAHLYYHCDDPPKWIVQNLFQDIVESLFLTSKTPEGLLKLSHPLLADYLIAEFLFEHLEQDKSPLMKSPAIRDLIISKVLVVGDFKGVRIFLNAMLECAITHEQDYHEPFTPGARVPNILNHCKFNDRLVQLVSSGNSQDTVCVMENRKLVLEVAGREKNVGILNWLFSCAKESLMRTNRGVKWHESMLNFLDPLDSTFIHVSSASCEADVQVSERVSRWFEHADSSVLKKLLNCTREVELHPKVVFDFIIRHKRLLDADYLANFLFYTGVDYNLFDMIRARNWLEESDGNCVDVVIDYVKQVFPKGAVRSQVVDWFVNIDWRVAELEGALLKLLTLSVEHFELKEADVRRVVSHALKMDAKVILMDNFTFPNQEEWRLDEILQTDSFSLTNLHRAAMYGSLGAVRKMLRAVSKGKILNDPLADVISNSILMEDLHGITPLYLAARCGHEEICEAIIQFQQSRFAFEVVKWNAISPAGCLRVALTDAVPKRNGWSHVKANRCRFEAIECILTVVLRHYGRESLYSLVTRESWTLLLSMFENLGDLTVVVKFVKFIYQLLGMHGLSDIFCNPLHLEIFAHFAEESRNDVLKLLLESLLTCKGDIALVNFLLAGARGRNESHYRGFDPVQNVMLILMNPMVRCYLPGKLRPAGLERFVQLLSVVHHPNQGGRSIWSAYCTHMRKPVDHIGDILRSTLNEPSLGERKVKELVLHDDGNGSVFELAAKRDWTDLIQVMLDNLPTMAHQVQSESCETFV